ncbi:hypothetical protein FDP22_12690 [Paroceanicella profunda]|uniref:Uncharacterized protein n=1 Tax=Paroceanicella profunda TaxID=2579971 RepID=A0A5B8FVU8_9RHOB|nr:hypothetical protein [Paroceanicella profunda]QDL92565.1 hypothetical protein FDP22_12690 [Paroceanicella profunda]
MSFTRQRTPPQHVGDTELWTIRHDGKAIAYIRQQPQLPFEIRHLWWVSPQWYPPAPRPSCETLDEALAEVKRLYLEALEAGPVKLTPDRPQWNKDGPW